MCFLSPVACKQVRESWHVMNGGLSLCSIKQEGRRRVNQHTVNESCKTFRWFRLLLPNESHSILVDRSKAVVSLHSVSWVFKRPVYLQSTTINKVLILRRNHKLPIEMPIMQ